MSEPTPQDHEQARAIVAEYTDHAKGYTGMAHAIAAALAERREPDAEIAKAARELARFLISGNMDMGEGPRDFTLTISPKDGPPRGREVRDAACRNLIAAVRGDSWNEAKP